MPAIQRPYGFSPTTWSDVLSNWQDLAQNPTVPTTGTFSHNVNWPALLKAITSPIEAADPMGLAMMGGFFTKTPQAIRKLPMAELEKSIKLFKPFVEKEGYQWTGKEFPGQFAGISDEWANKYGAPYRELVRRRELEYQAKKKGKEIPSIAKNLLGEERGSFSNKPLTAAERIYTPEYRKTVLEGLATTPERKQLLEITLPELEKHLATLPKGTEAYVGGSYPSAKPNPRDLDVFEMFPSLRKFWNSPVGKKPIKALDISEWPPAVASENKGKILQEGQKRYGPDYDWLRILSAAGILPASQLLGGESQAQPIKQRYFGGPVNANQPYIVGEGGKEIFVPDITEQDIIWEQDLPQTEIIPGWKEAGMAEEMEAFKPPWEEAGIAEQMEAFKSRLPELFRPLEEAEARGLQPPNTLGYPVREPYPSENEFFKTRPEVSGMYTEDRKIILNPYSKLSEQEKKAVLKLEAYRLFMDDNNIQPAFDLTPEQINKFKGTEYGGDLNALKLSIISRILVGDPSTGNITPEQKAFAEKVRVKASQAISSQQEAKVVDILEQNLPIEIILGTGIPGWKEAGIAEQMEAFKPWEEAGIAEQMDLFRPKEEVPKKVEEPIKKVEEPIKKVEKLLPPPSIKIDLKKEKAKKAVEKYEKIGFLIKKLDNLKTFKNVVEVLALPDTKKSMKENGIAEEDIFPYIWKRFPEVKSRLDALAMSKKKSLYSPSVVGKQGVEIFVPKQPGQIIPMKSVSPVVNPLYRGKVVQNPNGTTSSERTITVGIEGKYYNIPTLMNGKQLSNDQAIFYFKRGELPAVGVASSLKEAIAMASARSKALEKEAQWKNQDLSNL